MKKRNMLLMSMLLWLGNAWVACAQPVASKYLCKNLEELAGRLQTDYNIDCSRVATYPLQQNTVVVSRNSCREIDHIGFQLFPPLIMEQNPSPAYRFVERYLLQLFLKKSDADINASLREDKVTLRLGTLPLRKEIHKSLAAVLPEIARCQSFVVTTDNNYYAVSWYEGNRQLLLVRFPIQYELLWGMNKKEVENLFYRDLMSYQPAATPKEESVEADYLKVLNDSCLVYEGDFYGIEAMNSNRYYRKGEKGKLLPVCNVWQPEESVCNLFTLYPDNRIQACVVQNLYSHRKLEFEVTLAKLIDFCRSNGCEPYVGIESIENGQVKGMVTLLNRSAGYNHLLYFSTDLRILLRPERFKMDVHLYAYVPTHNIQNLYFDKKQNK